MRSSSNISSQNGRGASELERTRRQLIENGLELTKHPRHGKPDIRVFQLNVDEGMLFWVGKGGERKVVQLKHVQKIEAADSEGENVMSSSPTFLKRGTPDNAHRYFTLFVSSEGSRSTLDLEAPTPMQRDMLIQILTEAL